MKTFPFTWLPGWFRPHESLWSLAYRLGVANRVPTKQIYEELFAPLQLSQYGWLMAGKGGARRLADLLGVPISIASTAFIDDVVSARVEEEKLAKHLRYCPLCLKDHFHSVLFQFHVLAKCPVHHVPLEDVCPHCKKTNHRHALEVTLEANCLHCGKPFLDRVPDWRAVVDTKVVSLPLTKCRQRLLRRKGKGYLEGALAPGESEPQEILRSFVASKARPRIEMNEFMVPKLVDYPLRADDVWAAMVSCRNALYSIFAQIPDRHADAFEAEYYMAFLEPRVVAPMGHPAVAAYRLLEQFMGILAPPNKGWELPEMSPRKFNKDYFSEHLDTYDHSQRLPINAGVAMAPLIVQSLYLDALEYVLSSTADRPWTIWAHDQHSFKYPVRWFALTTGKSNYQYQITVVTLATKARLQQTLTSF